MHLALLATIFLLREVEASTALASAWTFDHEALELTWLLPGSKTDHMALGVHRSWPCLCGLENFFCPFHLAIEHWAWLTAIEHFTCAADTPLFPTMEGKHANKVQVVDTFEAIGAAMGQPLHDHAGTRRFGATPRESPEPEY